MDNRLTQRLVGAGVVAALAVIFVPEMLETGKNSATGTATQTPPPSLRSPSKPLEPAVTFSQPKPAPATADNTPPAIEEAKALAPEPAPEEASEPVPATTATPPPAKASVDTAGNTVSEPPVAKTPPAPASPPLSEPPAARTRLSPVRPTETEKITQEEALSHKAQQDAALKARAKAEAERAVKSQAELARKAAQAEAARKTNQAEAERIAAARAQAQATQQAAQAEAARIRAKAEAERIAKARMEAERIEALRDAAKPASSMPMESRAARVEVDRAAEAARRQAARAEAAALSARIEAAQKTARAEAARSEAARAEMARRQAQAEAASVRQLTKPPADVFSNRQPNPLRNATPTVRDTPDTTSRRVPSMDNEPREMGTMNAPETTRANNRLPKLQLLAKSENPSVTASRPTISPPIARPQPSTGGPGVVAGNYVLQENANSLRDYYRNQNVRVAIERVTVNGRQMYQVRIWR